jgi:hypothetical protein
MPNVTHAALNDVLRDVEILRATTKEPHINSELKRIADKVDMLRDVAKEFG